MTAPTKVNMKIYQGSTFEEIFRWETAVKVYKPITNITKAAPIVITAATHGVPTGWRVRVSNVNGMKEINSETTQHIATVIDPSSISINEINAVGYSDYISGGILEYNEPKSLNGLTARMQIRAKTTSTDTLLELTTINGMIILNDVSKTITVTIPAATTQTLTFKSAVYSLELVDGAVVIPFIYGTITLDTEITR